MIVDPPANENEVSADNVLGGPLAVCGTDPVTGFFRDGCCNTGSMDHGVHTVCAIMTDDFLHFTKAVGNDLSTPRPEFNFPGLNPGDRWCLCAARWLQAHEAGHAPQVVLAATHIKTLDIVPLDALKQHAVDLN
ncbi:MAG: DUF2237 domain-containing protein [Pseudomonadota bacterium]